MKDSKQYDEWAEGYDSFVSDKDLHGKYPFAGYESVLLTVKRTIDAYDPQGSILDLGCGTGALEKQLDGKAHAITAIDFSPKMIEEGKNKNSDVNYILADLSDGVLPKELEGKKFKIIVSTFFFHRLEESTREKLIRDLVSNHLEEKGLFLIGDTMFGNDTELEVTKENNENTWEKENYIVFNKFKDFVKGAVFQKVSFCTGIIGFRKPEEPKVEPVKEEVKPVAQEAKAIEQPIKEQVQPVAKEAKASEEVKEEKPQGEEKPAEETKEESNTENAEQKIQLTEYSEKEVASWRRVREIPGDTILEFGTNFIRAIAPYETEAIKNWKYLANQLQNSYGGTFSNSDIANYRTQAVSIIVNVNNKLPSTDSEKQWSARMVASSFLHNHFPGNKINLNLYGLYYGLVIDILAVLKRIEADYGTDCEAVKRDLEHIEGTKLLNDLAYGLR